MLIGTYQFPLLDKPATEEGFPIPDDEVEVHEEGDDADDVSLEPEEGDVVIPDAHAEASEAEVKKVIESEEAWRALKDHATKPVRMINFMVAEPLKSKHKIGSVGRYTTYLGQASTSRVSSCANSYRPRRRICESGFPHILRGPTDLSYHRGPRIATN